MKLKVTYELNISPENEALINVIASQEGWVGVGSAQDYINEFVTKPPVKLLFNQIIERAVKAYHGLKDKQTADAVMTQYESAHTVTSEFIA